MVYGDRLGYAGEENVHSYMYDCTYKHVGIVTYIQAIYFSGIFLYLRLCRARVLKRRRTVMMGTCTGSVVVRARHDEAQLFSTSVTNCYSRPSILISPRSGWLGS